MCLHALVPGPRSPRTDRCRYKRLMTQDSQTATPVVALTGATGKVGGMVAGLVHHAGFSPRLLVRDPSRAPAWAHDVRVTTYADAAATRKALHGVHTLFMVSAAESADRLDHHRTLIDAAAAAGVTHIVYTSFLAASPQATFTLARTHAATEEHLRGSGMAFTFLRDSFYADFLPDLAVEGVIAGPAGGGRVGAVARADVAASTAAVLRDLTSGSTEHTGATYDLTGPQALSLEEVARILTDHGRPTVYREQSVEEAYAARAGYGAPDWELDAWVSTYTAIASGELATISGDVRRLIGRPPLSLADLLD